MVKLTGLDHRLISPYNPRADGKVERSIGTVMSTVKKSLHGSNELWPLFVPAAQLAFNNKVASLTNSTPFSLMFNRTLVEMKDHTGADPIPVDLADWQSFQEKVISTIFPAISEDVLGKKQEMVQRIDAHRRQLKQSNFPAGSTVMLIDPLQQEQVRAQVRGPLHCRSPSSWWCL